MGIDTVRLGTGAFSLAPDHQMDDRSTQNYGQPRREKWVKNLGTLRTTIQPGFDGAPHLSVEVSAPKLLYGDSLNEVTDRDLFPFVERVTNDLEGFGVRVDVESMTVGRVDACRNVFLSHDVSSFIEGCAQFHVGRMQRHCYAGETVRWGNGAQSSMYYDKEQETAMWKLDLARRAKDRERICQAQEQVKALSTRPHYILRAESAAKNTKKAAALFRVAHPILSDVWSDEKCRDILVAHFDEMRNGGKGRTAPPLFDDLVQWLREARERGKRNALLEVMAMKGAPATIHGVGGSEDGLRRALLCSGFDRSSAYRQIQKVRRFVTHGLNVNTHDLLAEVREKLAA